MTLASVSPPPAAPAPWISIATTSPRGVLEWDFLAVDGAEVKYADDRDAVATAENIGAEFGDVKQACHDALDEFLDRVHTTSTAISFAVIR